MLWKYNIFSREKVPVTLADFALDALKKCTSCVLFCRREALGRCSKKPGIFSRSKNLCQAARGLRFSLGTGLGCLGARHRWCSAYRNEEVCFCKFCIGLPQPTRIAVSRNAFCNRESDSVTIFANVFFDIWSKFASKGKIKKCPKFSFFLQRIPVALP